LVEKAIAIIHEFDKRSFHQKREYVDRAYSTKTSFDYCFIPERFKKCYEHEKQVTMADMPLIIWYQTLNRVP